MSGYAFILILITVLLLAFLVWVFRDRITSIKLFGGNEITMTPKATLDLARNGQALVRYAAVESEPQAQVVSPAAIESREAVGIPTVTVSDEAHGADDITIDKHEGDHDIEDQRQAQLELIINAAAQWGWAAAKLGAFSTFPHPVVEWRDRQPYIAFGSTDEQRLVKIERRASGGAHIELTGGVTQTPRAAAQAHIDLSGQGG